MTFATDDRASDRSIVPDLPGDDVLLEAARSGSSEAFRTLQERYLETALAVARVRTGDAREAEKVVDAAFERIEQIVSEGHGPHSFLGAFVVWMVGREADGGTGPIALPEDPADPAAVVRAFTRLPAVWQAFLWHTEIQRWPVRRAAAALRISSIAAVPLQRDVFIGLRRAYRQMGAPAETSAGCEQCRGDLIGFVRGILSLQRTQDVQQHLDGCTGCTVEYLRYQDLGTGLRTWALPVLAGLPLWGAEAADVAGALEETDTSATGNRETRTSPWSGRGVKTLLGAGALVTAVAVTTVGLSSLGDPASDPDQVSAEQAPGSADDPGAAAAGAAPRAEAVDAASEDGPSAAPIASRGLDRGTGDPARDGADGSPDIVPENAFWGAPPAERETVRGAAGGDEATVGSAPMRVVANRSLDTVLVDRTGWGAKHPTTAPPAPPTDAPDTAPVRSGDADSGTERLSAPERPSVRQPATTAPLSAPQEEGTPTAVPSVRDSWPVVLLDPPPSQVPTPVARASYPPRIPVPTREAGGAESQWKTSKPHTPETERGGRAEQRRGGGENEGHGGKAHHDQRGQKDHWNEDHRVDLWPGDHRSHGEDGWGKKGHRAG